ncbi:hypothetical protein OCGS_1075 [Oceaniovalibus guishaninsula JLT2003]|uniref:Protein NnrT n=1 Tax=Oceaniovalibus guishaninsula JLT2003 TaxID=1231392 RepID=K2HE77_9RHOB|nr:hypothetical protein [Oceaniovalibus guishaninsula]EKE44842.1 hypothetical protein OCGS_1075 [Oceaniovalibus guishaninsula JLT2003]
MRHLTATILTLLPGAALAQGYDRPVPGVHDATAELWFLAASIAFLAALLAVHLLVNRKP